MPASARPRRPSLEDVAARAGVSRATVSRVVNGATTVDSTIAARVDRAVHELGYQPNLSARALVNRRTDTLALIASESDTRVFGDPFFSRIVQGATLEAGAAGMQLVLFMPQERTELERAERYVRSGAVDGALLISQHEADVRLPETLSRAGVPVVIGGRPFNEDLDVPFVDNDNVTGGRLAARRLVAIGRRRIGTITGSKDMTAGIDRLAGFRAELGEAFRPDLVEQGEFTQDSGLAAAQRLLERAPDVDAIFAASDLMALGAIQVLHRTGRRVPEDVAVVGFDDIQVAASAAPPLTTIRQQTALQGRAMVRLLLARTRPDLELPPLPGLPGPATASHLVLPVELVERASA
ncbi:LacI family DNA-binding transcriptional regulator [Isoptericola sp. b441]|uniref:LacI family DNA-binding transcriptional regulator n=1 Tax=Actinotalea lenta TaxID=3064654 RepID=A0ABT9D536_9CELL|nr:MULTISPECIES: LacI family DNA-binding transcriptional regulator [unclassified Isoptericola]MDO8105841.1 LacI family DNA-binding transcriptional regulator [Isoptericola sp. b441]MDO8122546.1 LacI family DNA-binding transcriptional regulator [Isoptericola sp. b490]